MGSLERKSYRRILSILIESSLDQILPPHCLVCRSRLQDSGKLCGSCWREIRFITKPVCYCLGTPLPYAIDPATLSAAALARKTSYTRARVVGVYDQVLRKLVHDYKFRDKVELTNFFVPLLMQAGVELLREAEQISAVPLNRWRLWSRRYNQSALLAKSLSKQCQINYDAFLLKRVKRTRSQIGLTYRQRLKNVSGAFLVPENKSDLVQDKRILLIDDVVTTGSTVEACANALLKSGAKSVDVLAIARVLYPQSN